MESRSQETSPSLLERATARDPSAWQRLVRIYGPLVYDWARERGLQASDAADIVQDVFAAVCTSLARFERAKAAHGFRGWLWGIYAHKLQDYFRERHSRPDAKGGTTANIRLQLIPEVPAAQDSEAGNAEIHRLRQRALSRFSELFQDQVWKAFWEVVVQERLPRDVAEDLGVSVWVVYKSKARVLERLRRELEGLAELLEEA